MGEFLKKHDTLSPWMEIPERFFNMVEPPKYRKDAIKLIPEVWDKMKPPERKQILGTKISNVEDNFFNLSWEEIVKMWGEEEALRTFLYALYGDDTDPLYTSDDKFL